MVTQGPRLPFSHCSTISQGRVSRLSAFDVWVWVILGCPLHHRVFSSISEVAEPGLESHSQPDMSLCSIASLCPSRSPCPFPTFLSSLGGTNGPLSPLPSGWPVGKGESAPPLRSPVNCDPHPKSQLLFEMSLHTALSFMVFF